MDKKIKQRLQEVFSQIFPRTEISFAGDLDSLIVTVRRKNDSIDLQFAHLLSISKQLNTDKINTTQYHAAGCPSCDYGSADTVTLFIDEVTLPVE